MPREETCTTGYKKCALVCVSICESIHHYGTRIPVGRGWYGKNLIVECCKVVDDTILLNGFECGHNRIPIFWSMSR